MEEHLYNPQALRLIREEVKRLLRELDEMECHEAPRPSRKSAECYPCGLEPGNKDFDPYCNGCSHFWRDCGGYY